MKKALQTPLVSIIIPTYNRAHFIGETLDSIQAQTYTNWECIVVDDGSSDNTDEVLVDYIKKDIRFQYHPRPKDRLPGGNAARNYGYELSRGEYIQWFDSDDLMLPKKIEFQLNSIQNENADFSVCEGAAFLNNPLIYKKKWDLHKNGDLLFNHIKGNVVFGTNGPLFLKSFLEGNKLFNESLIIRQEWEFFNRILIRKPNVIIVNNILYLYRNMEDGIRGSINYNKHKCKMVTNRLTLREINNSMVFNKDLDFLYRRFVLMMVIHNSKRVLKEGKYGDLFYLFNTFLISLNFNYLYVSVKKILNKPIILINIFESVFKKNNNA